MNIPKRYAPDSLTEKDKKKQIKAIKKSRKAYKEGKFIDRPKIKSFKSKPSSIVQKAKEFYDLDTIKPNKELSDKCGCPVPTLKKVYNKGLAAYASSGSRPNVSPQQWATGRLSSVVLGLKAARVDQNLLRRSCRKNSTVLRLMKQSGY